MISVIILNWKRPDNIIKDILPEIINYKLVNEVIISHGNKETYFEIVELGAGDGKKTKKLLKKHQW